MCRSEEEAGVTKEEKRQRPLQHTQLEMSPEDYTRITHSASKMAQRGKEPANKPGGLSSTMETHMVGRENQLPQVVF